VHLKQKESRETGSCQQVEATPLLRAMTITRKLDDIFFLSETSLSACPAALHLHDFF
jgi:hypothetical protein